MDWFHIFQLGFGVFLILLGVLFLISGKAWAGWWIIGTSKFDTYLGWPCCKRDSNPGLYWVLVAIVFVGGLLILLFTYIDHINT